MPNAETNTPAAARPRCYRRGLSGVGRLAPLFAVPWVVLIAGCTVGPDFHRSAAPATDRYTEGPTPSATVASNVSGGAQQRLEVGRDIAGDWWTMFRSPRLTALETQALRANPDLKAAQATLREAGENLRAEQGSLFPTITASGSATREKLSPYEFGLPASTSIPAATVYSASLNLSYTLDVFGGIRRQIEQLGAQVDYQRFELEATYLSLTSNVAAEALTEASLQAQIEATLDIIKIYQEQLAVMQQRFEAGGVSRAEVLSQQSNLPSAQATLPPLQKQLQEARNQLAVYVGGTPSQFSGPTLDLASLTLPVDLPLSVPSRLVEQRPDIQAYEALLHSASAEVGVATANMLPQFSLTASYGRDGTTPAQLFTPAGLVWSLAGSVSQTIFDGGALRAKRRSAVAALDVAAAQYSSTVNSAFQSVANALVAIERDAETLRADAQSEHTAAESLRVAQAQYRAGGVTYVTVLQAQQAYQSARLTLVSAQVARFTDTVTLYQALGGGWWNRSDAQASATSCCGILP